MSRWEWESPDHHKRFWGKTILGALGVVMGFSLSGFEGLALPFWADLVFVVAGLAYGLVLLRGRMGAAAEEGELVACRWTLFPSKETRVPLAEVAALGLRADPDDEDGVALDDVLGIIPVVAVREGGERVQLVQTKSRDEALRLADEIGRRLGVELADDPSEVEGEEDRQEDRGLSPEAAPPRRGPIEEHEEAGGVELVLPPDLFSRRTFVTLLALGFIGSNTMLMTLLLVDIDPVEQEQSFNHLIWILMAVLVLLPTGLIYLRFRRRARIRARPDGLTILRPYLLGWKEEAFPRERGVSVNVREGSWLVKGKVLRIQAGGRRVDLGESLEPRNLEWLRRRIEGAWADGGR